MRHLTAALADPARTARWPTQASASALQSQKKPDEAIAEYREAIRLKPDYAAPTTTSATP